MKKTDIIIIGSGIAALQLASQLQEQVNVTIITKKAITNSNSFHAQGGIAAAISTNDNAYDHYQDTIIAGDQHGNATAIYDLVTEGRLFMQDWVRLAPFDTHADGKISLGLEGAHRKARIAHCGGDQTGKYVIHFLLDLLRSSTRIHWIENEMVIDLLQNKSGRCIGVTTKDKNEVSHTYMANHVVLATGGAGGLYANTSNASSITGDGIVLAYRAGAKICDMEFFQFHPTLLYINGKSVGLISEAVRGAGARLINDAGEQIMKDVHPQRDLAPRHIVAHQLFQQINSRRKIYLDIRQVRDFSTKFPAITKMLQQHGISMKAGKIPVAPGAHFMIGGILINTWGATSVKGLYAIGEIAASGVHGANRLASNSLLEGLVYAADYNGSTKYIIETIKQAKVGSAWAIGTEMNLVQRIIHNHPDKHIISLNPYMCPCLTMNRIDLPHLLWSLESIKEGKPVNQITVDKQTASNARLALERMLERG